MSRLLRNGRQWPSDYTCWFKGRVPLEMRKETDKNIRTFRAVNASVD